MANLQNFAVARAGTVNVTNFPRYAITAIVEEEDALNGGMKVIADYTGANTLMFPGVMTTLTQAQFDAFVQQAATWIVRAKAGLED